MTQARSSPTDQLNNPRVSWKDQQRSRLASSYGARRAPPPPPPSSQSVSPAPVVHSDEVVELMFSIDDLLYEHQGSSAHVVRESPLRTVFTAISPDCDIEVRTCSDEDDEEIIRIFRSMDRTLSAH